MTEPETIYSQADVALALDVSPSAIANHRSRHDDTPMPAFRGTDGRHFWTVEGLTAWHGWARELRRKKRKNNVS